MTKQMLADEVETVNDENEQRPLWDFAAMVEVTIDKPARSIWPYFFEKKKEIWSNAEYVPVAGESREVGELYMMTTRPTRGGHLFYETINLVPEKYLALKITHREDEGKERKLVGYDIVSLHEAAGHTTAMLHQVFTFSVEPELDRVKGTQRQEGFLNEIMRNLKAAVERGA